MRGKFRILLCFFFTAICFSSVAQQISRRVLSDWTFSINTENIIHSATVPGDIQSDLIKENKLANPYYENIDTALSKLEKSTIIYECDFNCADVELNKNAVIRFNGLDTYAQVFLNDSLLFFSDNMFLSHDVSVGNILQSKNHLEIRFLSIDSIELSKIKALNYQLPEGNRVFTRKAQYQYGWDFAPKIKTIGIWKPIELFFFKNVFLQNLSVSNRPVNSSDYETTSLVDFYAEKDTLIQCTYYLSQFNKPIVNQFEIKPVYHNIIQCDTLLKLVKGYNSIRINNIIKNPGLWSMEKDADKNYYFLTFNFSGQHLTKRIAFRDIKLDQTKDANGSSFKFIINGKPTFMKGVNIVPAGMFPASTPDSVYANLVKMAHDANMNMIRVWGGGYYLPDIFYNYCDEYGILVWQDFMFACAMYPGDDNFLASVKSEITQEVKRLSSHPCIALFCGNNEISEGWNNWGWQNQLHYSAQDSAHVQSDYMNLFEKLIPSIIDSIAPYSIYWPSSPKNGWGRKSSLKEGDCHYWGVWWGFEPFSNYHNRIPRFMSEYGFQGYPSNQLLLKYAGSIDSSDMRMRYHQKHPRGFETIATYLSRDYPIVKTDSSYAYLSQLMQAEEISRTAMIHRSSYPYCSGTLFWQLNDAWPSISWSSIDYSLQPKMLYSSIAKAYEEVAMFVDTNNHQWDLKIVNSTSSAIKAKLQIVQASTNTIDKPWFYEQNSITLNPDSVQKYGILQMVSDKNPNIIYQVRLYAEDGGLITSCWHFNTMPNKLPLVNPGIKIKRSNASTIEITNEHFVYGLRVTDKNGVVCQEVNGVHLLPNSKLSIPYTGDINSLS
ncbi:MAG: glycoside hydrolase family 2 protein, partial [Bacteroidota bacterium]